MKKHIIMAVCLLIAISAQAQIISTVAGNGSSGYAGDGGAATTAQINQAYGVAVDASGNFYIADYNNNRVRKVTSAGIISTIAGNGTPGFGGDGTVATAAELNGPNGVAVDASGNVYIADCGNNRIRKVTASGNISTVAGNGTAGYSGDGTAATTAELNNPTGVAVDVTGNIYIADLSNHRIRKVSTAGIISTFAGNGIAGSTGDGGLATMAEFSTPYTVAVDGTGTVCVADFSAECVRKIAVTGIISTIAGTGTSGSAGDGGPATAAQLNYPQGVCFDGSGNVYIADRSNNKIRKVLPVGVIVTFAGNGSLGFSGDGGPALASELDAPIAVCASSGGTVYIADKDNERIRKVRTGTTAIQPLENEPASIRLYPNPNNGIFTIIGSLHSPDDVTITLEVTDMVGHMVYSTKLPAQAGKINTEISLGGNLPNGMYVLCLQLGAERETFRFNVE